MGYLLVDHTQGGVGPFPWLKGEKQEWDTKPCNHCQKVLRIQIDGLRRGIETKHSCPTCSKPICDLCARIMDATKVCPGPMVARIERAVKAQEAGRTVDLYLEQNRYASQRLR